MSSDYSWMKAGVKAIALNHDRPDDEVHGEVFILSGEPYQLHPIEAIMNNVHPSNWFIKAEDTNGALSCKYLKPYKDDSKTLTTWDDIASDLGIDIRRLEETA